MDIFIPVTFKIIRFPKLNKYIGVAWNYDYAILISTKNYSEASEVIRNLNISCTESKVQLKWFDGYFNYSSDDQLVPTDDPLISELLNELSKHI